MKKQIVVLILVFSLVCLIVKTARKIPIPKPQGNINIVLVHNPCKYIMDKYVKRKAGHTSILESQVYEMSSRLRACEQRIQ
jgi:hypothetical protein